MTWKRLLTFASASAALAACDVGASSDSAVNGASGASPITYAHAGATECERPSGMPAVTLTYDDALSSQLVTAAPSLRQHRLKATFFLLDVRSNPQPWADLRADGHELSSHTFNHPCPQANTWVTPGKASEDYDQARMATELDQGLSLLHDLGQPPPYTFAYPCGIDWLGAAQESYVPLIQSRFSAARGVTPGFVERGVDLYEVPATFSTGSAAELVALAEQAKARGSWVVYGFHGIGGDTNAIAVDAHEALLTYLDQHREAIYVATFGELARCVPRSGVERWTDTMRARLRPCRSHPTGPETMFLKVA